MKYRLFGYRLIDWIQNPIRLLKNVCNKPLADGEHKKWWQFWK